MGISMKGWACLMAFAALLSGCASGIDTPPGLRGIVFTYKTRPYSPDLNNTSVADMEGSGQVIRIKEPFTGYGVSAEFNSNAVGDIAKKRGMKTVYFADMRELNILGIFRRRQLNIYGE